MRLAVTGGRGFNDRSLVFEVMDEFKKRWKVNLLIVGDATGADALAASWARERGVNLAIFPAHWDALGKRAGPARNSAMIMLLRPGHDAVLAFPGGKGTGNMVRKALGSLIRVDCVQADGWILRDIDSL